MTLFDPPTEIPRGPVVRARLVVAYDGSGFHGFADNPGVRTVAGVLREALERVLRHGIELTGAGRTDRGVHARGQVVSFDARADRFDPDALGRSLNKLVGPAIAVREIAAAPPDFDARRSATGRIYRYRIWNRPVHDPLLAPTTWHVAQPLDLAALRLGADPLIGEHDFSSFCRRPRGTGENQSGVGNVVGSARELASVPEPSLRRLVRRATWTDRGEGLLEFEIEAGSFCHQMVRSVVGTLVDMGLGRRKAGEMTAIVAARHRGAAGQMGPPEGLVLWEVLYPPAAL